MKPYPGEAPPRKDAAGEAPLRKDAAGEAPPEGNFGAGAEL